MRYGLLFFILIRPTANLFSQENVKVLLGSIKGRVIDSALNKPIHHATVTLFIVDSTKPVRIIATHHNGAFHADSLPAGDYRLVIGLVGYRMQEKKSLVLSTQQNDVDVGTVLLSADAPTTLANVTVTTQLGALIENKIDKLVYNADKDITSQGGMATDILKKIPMVSVDVDGNVDLLGSSNIRYLLNGRPSSIFGTNPAEALQAIPVSQIKSIEIITNPGAKYDAEGTGGIINIILKDSKVKGVNGSINLAGGTRLENGSLNLHTRTGKFGADAYFNGSGQLPSTTLHGTDLISYDSSGRLANHLLQNGQGEFQRHNLQAGLGIEWNINKRNNFSAGFRYHQYGNNNIGSSNLQQINYDSVGNIASRVFSMSHSNNRFDGRSLDWHADYRKSFAAKGQELTISFQSTSGNNETHFQRKQTYLANDSVFAAADNTNTGKDNEQSLQADYVQPLGKKAKIEMGVKLDTRKITSNTNANTFDPGSKNYYYDSLQSSTLVYNRDVYAGYTNFTFPLGKVFDIMTGLRYEHTNTDAVFYKVSNTQIPPYDTWVPSFIIAHRFEKKQMLKFSYARRVHRPGSHSLNPFVNTSDPLNITRGNPLLDPEIGDNYELAYDNPFKKGGSLNIVLFYRRISQDIQPYIVYYTSFPVGDSVYTNVAVTTPENIGIENNYGLNIYGSIPFTKKLNVRTNVTLFSRYIENGIVPGNNTTSFNYRIKMNVSYQFNNNFIVEAFGHFNSPRNEVQGRFPSFSSYNFAFRKQMWKKRGSFGFTTTNPFTKYVNQTTAIAGQGFILNTTRQLPYRSFGISFIYQFGKMEFKKGKEKEEKDDQDNTEEQN